MTWERARRPEQKEQRRAAILAAAEDLLGTRALADVSLSAIARAASVSKANVYRYFESREAILLDILLARTAVMGAAFEVAMAPLAGTGRLDEVAETVADTLVAHDKFMELFSVVSSVLEKNVSADAIRAFKRQISVALVRPINALHASLPRLSIEDARGVVMHVLLHASGLWSAAHPPDHVAAVLEEDEFAHMRLDYGATVRTHAHLVLRGAMLPGTLAPD